MEFSKTTNVFEDREFDGPKGNNLYISVFPGLSYDLSEKLSLETSINFLSLGYSHSVDEQDSYKNKTSNFYFGAGLNNIVNVGSINIGAKYKF